MTLNNKPIRIVIVDDSLAMLWGLGKLIQGEAPRMMLIGTARTDGEALVCAGLRPDVIVLDLDLCGYSSIEIIPALKQRSGGGVLVHTGLDDRRLHEDAMLFGAAGTVGKDASAALLLDAIVAAHAERSGGVDVSVLASTAAGAAPAAVRIDLLSPAELRLVADLVRCWQAPTAGALGTPVVLTQVVALYDKLGLRNRLELTRFAEEIESRTFALAKSGECSDVRSDAET